jgi:hypothetical protein
MMSRNELQARAEKAEAELADLKRWRDPVTDSPRDGEYLVYKGNFIVVCRYNHAEPKEYRWRRNGILLGYPDGWMSLPEVPQGKED